MPKKKEAKEEAPHGVLVAAAKTVGSAAGTVAATVGVTAKTPSKNKVLKLQKKNKSRLPRKRKKAARKAEKLA
jgi:hypothetical protein